MNKSIHRPVLALLGGLAAVTLVAACGSTSGGAATTKPTQSSAASGGMSAAPSTVPTSIEKPTTIKFWDVYNGSDGKAMDALVKQFEAENPKITVDRQFVGTFGDIGKKIVSALQAGTPPDLAIAYPSDVVNYLPSRKVLNLDSYVNSPSVGLSKADLADLLPEELTINRYESAKGSYMSFPFTANILVMYYNSDILQKAGISSPPKTWDEFATQCAKIKAKEGLPCYSASSNASTMDGIAYSFGAEVMGTDGKPKFDSSQWGAALEALDKLGQSGEAQLTSGQASVASPDVSSFVGGGAAFILSTSRNVPFVQDTVGSAFKWGIASIPQAVQTDKPVTTLYGPGTVAFASGNTDRELASWLFAKYLASAPAQASWAGATGNLPIRPSVTDAAAYQSRLKTYPATKDALSLLPFARFEGSSGDDGVIALPIPEVRTAIENAMTSVLNGSGDVAKVQTTLQAAAVSAQSK